MGCDKVAPEKVEQQHQKHRSALRALKKSNEEALVEEGKEINSKRTNNSVESTNNSEKEGATKLPQKKWNNNTKNIEALYERLKIDLLLTQADTYTISLVSIIR